MNRVLAFLAMLVAGSAFAGSPTAVSVGYDPAFGERVVGFVDVYPARGVSVTAGVASGGRPFVGAALSPRFGAFELRLGLAAVDPSPVVGTGWAFEVGALYRRGRWVVGLRHYSNGNGIYEHCRCANYGYNFVTVGWSVF